MEWATTLSECFWYQPHGGYAGIGLSVVGSSTEDIKVLLYLARGAQIATEPS
jgi:hypothetical protein